MTIKQVLVVDDDDLLREVVQACLEDLAGWKTQTARSGEECLKIVQQQAFDAIVLDISMPKMDGFAVFERLHSNPNTQSIPVILLTARVLLHDLDHFSQMGIAGVISKPVEPTVLIEEMVRMLGWNQA